ncbi:MAG: tRNA lysidine(34) synthetase TilS [Pseudomonadota bacterium]
MASDSAVTEAVTLAVSQAQVSERSQLYVGFSGGVDSTVLLHAVWQLYPTRVTALHANHQLQPDARNWQRHCESVCRSLGVSFLTSLTPPRTSDSGPEAAARDARYEWFESVLGEGDLLLLAHHQDDQVETVLLRLLRGAGAAGLGGMAPQRAHGMGSVLRPLLNLPRAELESYAKSEKLMWIDDPSNASDAFDRNYLRHSVVPRLAERWPGYRATISRAARQLRELSGLLDESGLPTLFSAVGDPGLALSDLPDEAILAQEALRTWLRSMGCEVPNEARLVEFLRQLRGSEGGLLEMDQYLLQRYRHRLYCRPHGADEVPSPVTLEASGRFPWADGSQVHVKGVERAEQGLRLRTRGPGDRIKLADGHHHDLKKVFQDHGLPPWWRHQIPLLCSAGSQGERVLAVGHLARAPEAIARGLSLDWEAPVFRP